MHQKTLGIIKPDATKRNLIGKIIAHIENSSLSIHAIKITKLNVKEAEDFYEEHKEKPFFRDLINYMTSYKVVLIAIEGENAVEKYREIMGSTNPKNAQEGTIRKLYAIDMQSNSVHGSDSTKSAKRELEYFNLN